jgi:hypothetical protein
MAIDFEKDQEDLLNRTENIDKLADKIKQLEGMQHELEIREDALKEHKKQIENLSGEVIPTMMSEMGLSQLKLADGSSVDVKPHYIFWS